MCKVSGTILGVTRSVNRQRKDVEAKAKLLLSASQSLLGNGVTEDLSQVRNSDLAAADSPQPIEHRGKHQQDR